MYFIVIVFAALIIVNATVVTDNRNHNIEVVNPEGRLTKLDPLLVAEYKKAFNSQAHQRLTNAHKRVSKSMKISLDTTEVAALDDENDHSRGLADIPPAAPANGKELPPRITMLENDDFIDMKTYSGPSCGTAELMYYAGSRIGSCLEDASEGTSSYYVDTGVMYHIGSALYAHVATASFNDDQCTVAKETGDFAGYIRLNTCYFDVEANSYIRFNHYSTLPTNSEAQGIITFQFSTSTTCQKQKNKYINYYEFTRADLIGMCIKIYEGTSIRRTCRDGVLQYELHANNNCAGSFSSYLDSDSCDENRSRDYCVGGSWAPALVAASA